MKAILALTDGTYYIGRSFGAEGEAVGEVVFNTSMTGYQEILTDPSYEGQLVAMTYPEIGNVGVNPEDVESQKPFVKGFIVKEYCAKPSNWRATRTLGDYMREHGIVGIEGIDTRALVRRLRDQGSQEAIISTRSDSPEELIAKAKASPGLVGRDLVKEVSCREAYDWSEGRWELGEGYRKREESEQPQKSRKPKTPSLDRPGFFVSGRNRSSRRKAVSRKLRASTGRDSSSW